MHICGIICEYNPFHRGHEKQLRQVRQALGADAAVVCLMSGSFVQRGEPAIFEKRVRAQAAVLAGANLVLELPVTKALCSAEGFARGGVEIFSKLGIIDTLAFGCESGDGQAIFTAAQAMCAASYDRALREILDTGASYPAARQRALCCFTRSRALTFPPNSKIFIGTVKLQIVSEGLYKATARTLPRFRSISFTNTYPSFSC